MRAFILPPVRRQWAAACFACVVAAAAWTPAALSQSSDSLLPDDPSAVAVSQSPGTPQTSPAGPPHTPDIPEGTDLSGRQTKRILGIVPNFRSVSVDVKLPPESAEEKFKESTQDAFDYSDFVFVAMLAGVGQAENSYPEFGQGAVGYGRYYWHSLADQIDEDYQVEFLFPVALHQDPRYYTLGRGGFLKRAGYAFSRIVVTRTDAGNETFNTSEVVGAGAAAGISGLYYPSPERTWTKTGQRWVVDVGLDGATFIFQEFWPDINSRFFHEKE